MTCLPLRIARATLLAATLGVGLWAYARPGHRYSYAGTPVASGRAPQLVLPDDHGGMFDLAAHRGEVVLVYFGYTHCPDVCPATLGALQAALARLGPDHRQVRQVFVTLDPRRDTPRVLRDYLANFEPAPTGLTGTPTAVASAARAWGVTWRPAEGGAYFDHTSAVVLIGPDGRQRLRYGFSQIGDASAMARDIEHVLHAG